MGAAHLFGRDAAQKIDLIRRGSGDEQVRGFRPCLPEHLHAGPVAVDRQNIEIFLRIPQRTHVVVDNHDIVAFLCQLFGQHGAHFTVPDDYNPHGIPSLQALWKVRFFRRAIRYCAATISSRYSYIAEMANGFAACTAAQFIGFIHFKPCLL